MLAALKIPKAFLSFEEDLSGKATLAAEDLRFAKTIHRLQKIIASELTKIAVIHLYSQGYTDESLVNFTLEMTNPSTILEKEKIEIWSNKMGVAKDMLDTKTFSTDWIYKNVFTLTDGDVTDVRNQIVEDVKRGWRFKQIEEEGNDPALSMQKVNDDGSLTDTEKEPEAGGDEGLPDIGGLGGEPELGGEGGPGGEEPEGGGGGGKPESEKGGGEEAPPLKETVSDRPSQAGEKKASDYPFGEDPLGSLELNAGFESAKKPGHKYKNNSPLSLDEKNKFDVNNLASFLKKNVKRELLGEVKKLKIKSMLDEGNIKDE
jgi:hypothetical protein